MKRIILERSFVAVLFVLVIVIFSFAERDTQKRFQKFNTKSTVDLPSTTPDVTADIPVQAVQAAKVSRN